MDRDGALVWGLNGLGVVLALGCLFAPFTPVLVACALVPWAALVVIALLNGRLVVSVDRPEKRPNILLMIVVPEAALAIKGTSNCTFIDWRLALAVAAVVSLIWFFAFVVIQRAKRPRSMVSLAVLLLIAGEGYGVGGIALADVVGDKTITATYTPRILAKTPRQGRNDDILVLAPWDGRPGGNEPVAYDLFNAVKVGDQVCIDVHPGRIGFKWYQIRPCQTASEG